MDDQQITNVEENEGDKKFNSLPEEIQDIIYSPITEEAILDIGEKYELHLDKLDTLQLATEAVMTGDVPAAQFIPHLKKELSVDQQTAEKIGKEIDTEVFENIRDAIKSLSQPKEVEAVQEKPAGTPTTPELETLPVVAEENLPVVTKTKTEEPKRTIADIKTKQTTSSPVTTSNYNIDPYREPIE